MKRGVGANKACRSGVTYKRKPAPYRTPTREPDRTEQQSNIFIYATATRTADRIVRVACVAVHTRAVAVPHVP